MTTQIPAAERCSAQWLRDDLPAWVTASRANFWIALEQPGPWGAKALTESHLDPDLGRHLETTCSQSGGRAVLIRHFGRHVDTGEGPFQVFIAGGLAAGTPMKEIPVDTVFLGSCTNSRIEDLRAAAEIDNGRAKAQNVRMMVVPGSAKVRLQAEAEGLDRVFKDFGADWRFAGCSMCLGMNPDQLAPGERCASTSNRNFEGRQGRGGRTHLVSPAVAAATAIAGHFATPEDL